LITATAFVILMLGLLILGGPRLARKFLRSFFIGIDLYVILSVNGKDVAYKNPEGVLGREDKPLEIFPYELLYSDQFETYYNVCWFECGTLFRCGHSFHRTTENALYCPKTNMPDFSIGRVLEER